MKCENQIVFYACLMIFCLWLLLFGFAYNYEEYPLNQIPGAIIVVICGSISLLSFFKLCDLDAQKSSVPQKDE